METSKVIEIKVGNYARVKNFNYVGKVIKVESDGKVTLEFETSNGESWCQSTYLKGGVENLHDDDRFSECSMDFTGKMVIYGGAIYQVKSQVNYANRSSEFVLVRFRGNETRVHCDVSDVAEIVPGTILRRRAGGLVEVKNIDREEISFTEDIMSQDPLVETYSLDSVIRTLSAVSPSDEEVSGYLLYAHNYAGSLVIDQRIGKMSVGLKTKNKKSSWVDKAKKAAFYIGIGIATAYLYSYESKRLYNIFKNYEG